MDSLDVMKSVFGNLTISQKKELLKSTIIMKFTSNIFNESLLRVM